MIDTDAVDVAIQKVLQPALDDNKPLQSGASQLKYSGPRSDTGYTGSQALSIKGDRAEFDLSRLKESWLEEQGGRRNRKLSDPADRRVPRDGHESRLLRHRAQGYNVKAVSCSSCCGHVSPPVVLKGPSGPVWVF